MVWKKLNSKTVYKNRYMSVTEEELITDHGDQITFGIVHKGDGVSIIPYDGEYYYLIKQYRYPVDYLGWEFPAGHMEHDSVEKAALAELHEEAGLIANKITEIGNYYEAPGHLDQKIHIYLATDLEKGEQSLEPAEKGIKVGKFKMEQIEEMIENGEIKDGLTLTALLYLRLYLKKSKIET